MTLTQAAETCGMTRASFYRAVDRMKQLEGCSAHLLRNSQTGGVVTGAGDLLAGGE